MCASERQGEECQVAYTLFGREEHSYILRGTGLYAKSLSGY